MSASGQNSQNIHLDGDEESELVLEGIKGDDIDESAEEVHLGDVTIENNQYAHGVRDVEADSVGSVKVPWNTYERSIAIEDSEIDTVRGDVQGRLVLENSDVNLIQGDATFSNRFAADSNNIELHGDLIKQRGGHTRGRDAAFDNSNMPTVIGEEVDVEYLDKESVGGLIIADEININETDGDMFAIATENSYRSSADVQFPASNRDNFERNWEEWEDFKQEIKDNSDQIYGIPIFAPDNLRGESQEEIDEIAELRETDYSDDKVDQIRDLFFAREKQLSNLLDEELDVDPQESIDEIAGRIGHLKAFTEVENRRYASLLNGVLNTEEENAEYLGKFGNEVINGGVSSGLDGETRDELLDRLNNEDLLYVSEQLKDSLDNFSTDALEEMIEAEADTYDLSHLKEDWEESEAWNKGFKSLGGMLETAYEQNEDLGNLIYLAEFVGEHVELETEQWIEEQKQKKQNDQEYDVDSIEDIEERLEGELGELKRDFTVQALEKIGEAGEDVELITSYEDLHPRFKGQIVDKLANDIANEDDFKRQKLREFGTVLNRLDDEVKDDIYQTLMTETDEEVIEGTVNDHGERVDYSSGDSKFGNTLFDVAVSRDYTFFVEDEAEEIERMLQSSGELPEVDPFFEQDSPYRQIVEDLTSDLEEGTDSDYGEMSDEELAEKLRRVRGLADNLGHDYDASNVFGMLKGKEGQRQNTDFTPDPEEIESLKADRRRELEKDVQNKLREYLKQSVEQVGYESAVEEYEDATGERPDELGEDELSALKVRQRLENGDLNTTDPSTGVETVDKLLNHQNNVYELEENQEWIENHGFTERQLIDPDLSGQEDSQYQRPEDADYRSALQVQIDEENVELDTEAEKKQYWEELTGLLGEAGIEEVEDVEDAEQAIQELDKEDNSDIYNEAKDVIGNYKSVENRESGVPDELTLHVADPMETTQMGRGFGSCHDVDGGSYAWASVSNAVDANKMVFYAEDEEGRERARVKGFITEDEELVYHNTSRYKDIDIDTTEYFEDYMSKVADDLGLELKDAGQVNVEESVELLEANDWYSNA